MAKDPAFLFYTGDFSTGTQFFTDEQVGKYVRLLMAQHQLGHLDMKHMIHICKTHDDDIFSKFIKDTDGKYYNERLENEIIKRKNYSKSRSENRQKNKEKNETYVNHMENKNENRNTYSSNKNLNVFSKIKAIEISEDFAIFPDGSKQPLGQSQKTRLMLDDLKPKDIQKGLIS